ncbi:MAG: hypothetical protein IKY33_04370 [Clostridia bacterium]|nr:hypothetical protein [Clostridia bacterium]
MGNHTKRYNASEVRLTHGVAGVVLFAVIGLSIWGIRKLHLMTGVAIFVSAPLLALAAAVLGVVYYRQKKSGADFAHQIWAVDYWFYVVLCAAIAHGMLLVSLPVDWWVYTAPMAYVLVAAMFVLYVSGWDQRGDFKCMGIVSLVAGLGAMLNYQTYYNPKQSFIVFRVVSQQAAFTIGWIVLCAALFVVWYTGKKKKFSVWKSLGVLLISTLFWAVLQFCPDYGRVITYVYGGILVLFYALLRVLRQIKIIS